VRCKHAARFQALYRTRQRLSCEGGHGCRERATDHLGSGHKWRLIDRTDVVAIHFKETPAHSSFDWHNDPEPQYVITLSGTLEFTTRDGETFVVRPGDEFVGQGVLRHSGNVKGPPNESGPTLTPCYD
jgi:hypothetical protein